jgi:hypothetical protein
MIPCQFIFLLLKPLDINAPLSTKICYFSFLVTSKKKELFVNPVLLDIFQKIIEFYYLIRKIRTLLSSEQTNIDVYFWGGSAVSGLRSTVLFLLQYQVRLPPLWSSGQNSWLQIQRSRVRFPVLPDFPRSSGSGAGSSQPREDN